VRPASRVQLSFDTNGVYVEEIRQNRQVKRKIAERIRLRALGSRIADGTVMAEVRFKTERGHCSEYFSKSTLLSHLRHVIRDRLADLGYEWPEDQTLSKAILNAIAASKPKRRFTMVDAPGWHDSMFILPDRVFSRGKPKIDVRIDPRTDAHVGAFVIGEGDLACWQETVAKPSCKSSRLRLAIATALAAPLLRPLRLDSFAINLFSPTSDGKTTCLKVAASVDGLIGDTGLPGWADSVAGLEDQARGHRDCLMPLDESADGDHVQMSLEKKARMLAFLFARNRPRKLSRIYERNNALRNREWRVAVLSSSERALSEVARSTGQPRLGGEDVRFTDVPASEPDALGIIDGEIKPTPGMTASETAKQIIQRLTENAIRYQGHAKRSFMEQYVADPDGLIKLEKYKTNFEATVQVKDNRKFYRIRSNFAAIFAAAALGIDYGVLPWGKRATFKAIEKCLRLALAQLDEAQNAPAEHAASISPEKLVNQLKVLLTKANIEITRQGARATTSECERRQKADGLLIDGNVYLKNERFRQWFVDAPSRSALIAYLKQTNTLCWNRADTPTIEKKISGISGKLRYYAIKMELLNGLPSSS
jgi:hypothetical protein